MPVSEIDFSQCVCEQQSDEYEIAGVPIHESGWFVDLDEATFQGQPILEISEGSLHIAVDEVKSQRGIV